MARKFEDEDRNIEQLNRMFPDHEMLTMQEVMQVTGYKSKDTVKKYYPFTNGKICKAKVARIMCL